MRNFLFSGIYPLLVYAANKDKIGEVALHHIQSINSYENKNYTTRSDYAQNLIAKIAELLKLGCVSNHYFTWYCPPENIKKNIQIIKKPEIQLNKNDLISSNIKFLFRDQEVRNCSVITEGASDLNLFSFKELIMQSINRIPTYLRSGCYNIPLLLRFFFWLHWTEESDFKIIINKLCNSDLVDEETLKLVMGCDLIYIPTDEVVEENYLEYLNAQLKKIDVTNLNILIKPHPRDTRDYRQYFLAAGFDSVEIYNDARMLPVEILIEKFKLKYFGGLSTALLYVTPDDSIVTQPMSTELIEFYKKSYSGLLRITKLKKIFYN